MEMPTRQLQFSKKGDFLGVVAFDRIFYLLKQTQMGKFTHFKSSNEKAVFCLAFSPNNRYFALGGSNSTAVFKLSLSGISTLWCQELHSDGVTSIVIDDSERYIASSDCFGEIIIRDIEGNLIRRFNRAHRDVINKLLFCKVNQKLLLLSCSLDRRVKLWDIYKPVVVKSIESESRFRDICLVPSLNTYHLLYPSTTNLILFDLEKKQEIGIIPFDNNFSIHRMDVSRTGELIAACYGPDFRRISIKSLTTQKKLSFKSGPVFSIDANFREGLAASISVGGIVNLWSFSTGQLIKQIKTKRIRASIVLLKNSIAILTSNQRRQLTLYNYDREILCSYEGFSEYVFSRNKGLLAIKKSNGVELWNSETKSLILRKPFMCRKIFAIDGALGGMFYICLDDDEGFKWIKFDHDSIEVLHKQSKDSVLDAALYPRKNKLFYVTAKKIFSYNVTARKLKSRYIIAANMSGEIKISLSYDTELELLLCFITSKGNSAHLLVVFNAITLECFGQQVQKFSSSTAYSHGYIFDAGMDQMLCCRSLVRTDSRFDSLMRWRSLNRLNCENLKIDGAKNVSRLVRSILVSSKNQFKLILDQRSENQLRMAFKLFRTKDPGCLLRRSAYYGHLGIIELLSKQDSIDINASDNNPKRLRTALHWAVIKRNVDTVKLLLRLGVLCNIKDAESKTARDYAQDDAKLQKIFESTHGSKVY